jgi:hypothetical protein
MGSGLDVAVSIGTPEESAIDCLPLLSKRQV